MAKPLHANHRQRQREKFRKGQLAPHEHIELMLYSSLKRINTNELAHELLDSFGGIRGMFTADEEQLTKIKGIGGETAVAIRNTAEIIRLYALENCHTDELLTSEFELYKFLTAIFTGACSESAFMLMFSGKGKFIGYAKLGEGLYAEASVSTKSAIKSALKAEAASVILTHNHPDGICIPSSADKNSAEKLNAAFAAIGVAVRAHYVVADGRCIKF